MKHIDRKILLNPSPATTTDIVKWALVTKDICPRKKDLGALTDAIKDDLVNVVRGEDEYKASLSTGEWKAAITNTVIFGKKR